MLKSGRAQQKPKQKAQKQPKQHKVAQKQQKRTKVTSTQFSLPQPTRQAASAASFAPKQLRQRQLTPSFTSPQSSLAAFTPFKLATAPSFSPLKFQKRNMSVLTHTSMKALVPCDPRFEDDEVISMLNPKTGLFEPVIVAVPEMSFEWVFSSPVDLHTFDVIPVVKDCIDPDNPTFESMDA